MYIHNISIYRKVWETMREEVSMQSVKRKTCFELVVAITRVNRKTCSELQSKANFNSVEGDEGVNAD